MSLHCPPGAMTFDRIALSKMTLSSKVNTRKRHGKLTVGEGSVQFCSSVSSRVSFYLTSFYQVPFCSMVFCWMLFCWMAVCSEAFSWISFCWMSWRPPQALVSSTKVFVARFHHFKRLDFTSFCNKLVLISLESFTLTLLTRENRKTF
jgi:hypothetical protein